MITKRERVRKTLKRMRHRLRPARSPAVPIFIFGEQRSGTNMLLRCFDASTEVEIFNETDDEAFVDYELLPLEQIQRLVSQSRASHAVFKPTADGNRAREIMDAFPNARAVWIYRRHSDVTNSAVALFTESSRDYLMKVATRSPDARWRAINVSEEDVGLCKDALRRGVSEQSARALIWYLRNKFYFQLGLGCDPNVKLIQYESVVTQPELEIGALFEFVGLRFGRRNIEKIFSTSVARRPAPEIDSGIADLCDALLAKLEEQTRLQCQIPVA